MIALCFLEIPNNLLALAIAITFWIIRLETCSTRMLIQGQSDVYSQMQAYLSSDDVVPVFDRSQPRSIATINRQSATTDVGGGGSKERE